MPKRKSAFNAALQEAQQAQTVTPSHSDTVEEDHQKEATQLHADTVPPQHSETVQAPHHITVEPLNSNTVKQQESDTVQGIIPSQSDAAEQLHAEKVTQLDRLTALEADLETVLQQQRDAVEQHQRQAVTLSHSETVEPSYGKDRFTAKISFYLTPEQGDKLDDLAHDFKKQHKKRINRNDIVRYLIDTCTLETLNGLNDLLNETNNSR